jgi:cell division protein FtsQ
VTAVAAPADRRFRRAHVKPARRRRGWHGLLRPLLLSAAVAAVGGYLAYRGAEAVIGAQVLQIRHITVHGNERLSQGETLTLLSGLEGESIVWANLDEWRRRLLASTWVRDATLRRSLPSTIDVAILERKPIALGRLNGGMYLIDERGAVIDEYGPEYVDLDLPIVDGLLVPSDSGGPSADEARASLAVSLISTLRADPTISHRISQINVTDVHNASLILNGDATVIYLGDTDFLKRLRTYLELNAALHERVANIDYVDLRFDNRIYVRPAGTVGGQAAAR